MRIDPESLVANATGSAGAAIRLEIEPYSGTNAFVRRMMSFLAANLGRDLLGAYVHGSLATGEEIPYSDFDALVVIRDDALREPKRRAEVTRKLRLAEGIMFEFDPLQHHGWFQLSEADLACYDESFLPRETFAYSRSLLPEQGLQLELRVRDSVASMRDAFRKGVSGIRANLRTGRLTQDLYKLKGALSLFMLLPALYVQARDGRGIYKKLSFATARGDFTAEEWTAMDQVSAIRREWVYDLSAFRRAVLRRPGPMRRHLMRLLAPPIPLGIRRHLNHKLLAGMDRLAQCMATKLGTN